MTIHTGDPFPAERGTPNQVRRARSRLPAGVTIWAAGEGRSRGGLTVSSMVVADGEPGLVFGLVKPETDFMDALLETETFTVSVLRQHHQHLADMFAGLAPAPGGMFRFGDWEQTPAGPGLADALAVIACRLDGLPGHAGYGMLVRGEIGRVEVDEQHDDPLVFHHGRYVELV